MAGKTISSTVGVTVTLGSSAYPSPLTITTAGEIAPAGYGAVGILLPQLGSLASIVNHGDVFGSNGGGSTTHLGGSGGDAVDLNSAAVLTTTGAIAAGSGQESNYNGGVGGIGIDVSANATIVNSGQISGGYGSYGFYTPGSGGAGVLLGSGTLTNSGAINGGKGGRSNSYTMYAYRTVTGGIGLSTGYGAVVTNTGQITGGSGSYTDQTSSYQVVGNSGATAVTLGVAGTLTNSGTITGGGGGTNGAATEEGGYGGDGVDLTSATASNSGLISGGTGAYGASAGGFGGDGVAVSDYGVFTNSGHVFGGAGGISDFRYGGGGGIGLEVFSYSTATNKGTIIGGLGGAGGDEGGSASSLGDGGLQGGVGAYILGGILNNTATIIGGAGGTTPGDLNNNTVHHDNAGIGNAGILLGAFYDTEPDIVLSASNYGLVRGGAGGGIISDEGTAGVGGYGALITAGTFNNHNIGTLLGGVGGSVGTGATTLIVAGIGGAGAGVETGATLINTGTILGGTGGTNSLSGTVGGAGVVILGGTFIDTGVVRGGSGGVSQAKGATGDAVYLGGSLGGTLVVNPGAAFTGSVVANGAGHDVLEVAGTLTTPLTGFGTEFTGFSAISFASGARRTIEGTFSGAAIGGFTVGDEIVLDSFAAIPGDTTIDAGYLSLSSASAHTLLSLSLLQSKDILIEVSGGKTMLIPATGTLAHTLGSEMAQLVASGGIATNSFIKTGGIVTIDQGGTASHTTIGGGTLVLDAGSTVTNGISFTTVTGGDLIIEASKMPAATLSGFIAGDTIKLANIAYNKSDLVTVGTAGFVTITGPGTVEILSIAGATKGETDFTFSTGSLLTRIATPKAEMAFLAPSAATPASPENLPVLTGFEAFLAHEIPQTPDSAKPASHPEAATLQNTGPALIHSLGAAAVTMSLHTELDPHLIHPNGFLI